MGRVSVLNKNFQEIILLYQFVFVCWWLCLFAKKLAKANYRALSAYTYIIVCGFAA